ncbi:MAG: AAA family ATPase, partial [Burkholderiales bacterium]|nr:AAA family ATPase [Burkholderiales bacterium]
RQRLGIAQALLGSPRLLFFDEPTNGLDPQAIRDFYRRIHALRDGGATIVISSHILAELQQRVDRLAIIADGRLRASGSVAELRSRTAMPVVFALELAPGDIAAAAASLAGIENLGVTVTDRGLDLACPAAQRATVLEAVLRLGPRLRNLQINEPSLEDMFFGLER